VARLVEAGKIKPFLGNVYPLSEVRQAWRNSRSKHIEGQLVFTVGAEEK
jgi:D-arabinose 1-dehydrogenase-like Zn-dependent alcohol dehydrogenase